jgi:hypothetical protein
MLTLLQKRLKLEQLQPKPLLMGLRAWHLRHAFHRPYPNYFHL